MPVLRMQAAIQPESIEVGAVKVSIHAHGRCCPPLAGRNALGKMGLEACLGVARRGTRGMADTA